MQRNANGCQAHYRQAHSNCRDHRHRRSHRRGGPAAAAPLTATATTTTAAPVNGAVAGVMRIATTATDPAATAAGRAAASATATPAATVTATAATAASSPRRARGSMYTDHDSYASDKDNDSREGPDEGKLPSESAEEEATLPSLRLSCPLSSGSITALWGPRTSVW